MPFKRKIGTTYKNPKGKKKNGLQKLIMRAKLDYLMLKQVLDTFEFTSEPLTNLFLEVNIVSRIPLSADWYTLP